MSGITLKNDLFDLTQVSSKLARRSSNIFCAKLSIVSCEHNRAHVLIVPDSSKLRLFPAYFLISTSIEFVNI